MIGKIKEQRSNKLIELDKKNEKEFLNKYINKEVEVLFENTKIGKFYKGHTTNYITVLARGKNLENQIVRVNIKEEKNLNLIGEII